MLKIIAALMAGAVALAIPAAAESATKKKKYVKRHAQEVGDRYGGSATARQRANSRAYDRGEYYEQMSDAHVFGSRSWWYLKEREMSGSNRN
jgi:hypothetical protein